MGRVVFDDFQFDTGTGELEGPEGTQRLRPQPARLLAILVSEPGRLFTREELATRMWPDTVVEFDPGLNNSVRAVRAALGDDASAPRFVETLPRRGYRFISDVRAEQVDEPQVDPSAPRPSPARPVAVLTTAAALALALGSGLFSSEPVEVPAPNGTSDPAAPTSAVAAEGDEFPAEAREAYESALVAIEHLDSREDLERILTFLEQAVALAPDYADAWTELAKARTTGGDWDGGLAAAETALALDPDIGDAHLEAASALMFGRGELRAAAEHVEHARGLLDESSSLYILTSWLDLFSGRPAPAVEAMEQALALDLVGTSVNQDASLLFSAVGRHAKAQDICRRTTEVLGESAGTLRCAIQNSLFGGEPDVPLAPMLRLAELAGDEDLRRRLLDAETEAVERLYWEWEAAVGAEFPGPSEYRRARALAQLGRSAEARASLNRAAESQGAWPLLMSRVDPGFRSDRSALDDRWLWEDRTPVEQHGAGS